MHNYYDDPGVRELCHAVKDRNPNAIRTMAMEFAQSGVVDENSIIIPAPQHEGYAIYTKEIADILSQLTGAKVLDILRCVPHRPLYEQKSQLGKFNPPTMYIVGEIEYAEDMYFLDNVLATGTTFNQANRLFNNQLKPLIYAKDVSIK